MTASPWGGRPPFSWLVEENTSSADGVFTTAPRRLIQYDVLAVDQLVQAVGAKQWRLLETLAWHSRHSPEHAGRRVVVATLAEIGQWAGGGDPGWSEGSIRPAVAELETTGLLERAGRRRRGYNRGSDPTTWILADGLFATGARPDHEQLATGLAAVTGGAPPTARRADTVTPKRARTPLGPTLTLVQGEPAPQQRDSLQRVGASLGDAGLAVSLRVALSSMGWNTSIDQALEEFGLIRVAAWICYAQERKLGGGFVRNSLKEGADHWPESHSPGTQYTGDRTGRIHAVRSTPPPEVTVDVAEASAQAAGLALTIRDLDAILEAADPDVAQEIRQVAQRAGNQHSGSSTHAPHAGGKFDVLAYRRAATEELRVRGLLSTPAAAD